MIRGSFVDKEGQKEKENALIEYPASWGNRSRQTHHYVSSDGSNARNCYPEHAWTGTMTDQ